VEDVYTRANLPKLIDINISPLRTDAPGSKRSIAALEPNVSFREEQP